MKTIRLIAGVTTAGLLGLSPLALSAPANATENLTTAVELKASKPAVTMGEQALITGGVVSSKGTSVYRGTVTLYAMSSKDADFAPVETVNASGYISFQHKPKSNTVYRAVYSGYTATSTYEDNLALSQSNDLPMAVQRKVTVKTNRLTLTGKVSPDFKRKKVVLRKVKGKKDKLVKWRTVKTNKKGVFKVRAPRQRGFRFAVTVPSDKHYAGWTSAYRVL